MTPDSLKIKTLDKKILKVAITGGIGSGKSTICKMFEILGIPIYHADARAKELMVTDENLIQKIKNLFGEEAYLEDGSLNRAYIANIVFKDKKILEQLNAIVHPAVFVDTDQWHHSQSGVPYTLKENAILFESGGHQLVDKTILVVAPEEVRIQRVIDRDDTTEEAVRDRISKQLPDEEKIKLADFVILNDGKAPLVSQVLRVHDALIQLNNTK